MKRKLKLTGALALAAFAAVALTGCPATKGDAPEPTSSNIKPGTNTQVIQMPDGFRNVVFSCFGTNGVYVTSRGVAEADPQASSVFVVPLDVHCTR